MTFFLSQAGAFVAWFLYGSFFEWAFHKYLFHTKLIPATYKAHDIRHHGLYSKGEKYDAPAPEDPNGRHIMMDWFALPLFLLFHLPILWGVQALTGIPSVWGGLAAISVYYALYETLHYFMHVPRNRWVEGTRVFLWLNDHHRLHHRDANKNLNVILPVADILLRTLWLPSKKAQAAGLTPPARARKRSVRATAK